MPLVVIEVDAHEAPRALAAALAEACSESIPQGECRYDEPAEGTPVAVATVKWDGAAERSVRIEVGTKRRGEPEWLTKTLQFRSVDPRAERWRSVGLTIATLVRELSVGVPAGDPLTAKGQGADAAGGPPSGLAAATETGGKAQGEATPAKEGEVAPGSPPASAPPEASSPAQGSVPADAGARAVASLAAARRDFRTPFWLDVGALAGPAFSSGEVRIGGFVAVGVQLASSPFFARFSLGHAAHPAGEDTLAASYTTLSAGAGGVLRWKPAQLSLEPRLALLVERLGVSARDELGRSDDSSQWTVGTHAGAGLVWELSWIAPVVDLEAFWRGPPTDIVQETRTVATVPGVSWTLQAAVRLFL